MLPKIVMFFFYFFIFLFPNIYCNNQRIFHGEDAAKTAAGFMACIKNSPTRSSCYCSGVVISSTIILTAAHCGPQPPNNYLEVIVGAYDRLEQTLPNPPPSLYRTTNLTFIGHPAYDRGVNKTKNKYADIAIIQVEPPIMSRQDYYYTFPNGTKHPNPYNPIALPFNPYEPGNKIWFDVNHPKVSTKCRYYGYGTVDTLMGHVIAPSRLQYTDVFYRFEDDYKFNGTSMGMMYIDSCNVKQGMTCGGDSGSPLFCEYHGRLELLGIHHGSHPRRSNTTTGSCGLAKSFMRAVEIRSHRHWIKETISKLPRRFHGNMNNFDPSCWQWNRTVESKMECGKKEVHFPVFGSFQSGTYFLMHGFVPQMNREKIKRVEELDDPMATNVPLYVRIDFENVLLNTKKDDKWVHTPDIKFEFSKCDYNKYRRKLMVEIAAKDNSFWIFCGKAILGEYKYELPIDEIDYIEVKGGIDLYDVDIDKIIYDDIPDEEDPLAA